MIGAACIFVCHGCGMRVDARTTLPFRCPDACRGDDTDHVLLPADDAVFFGPLNGDNPFLRYRGLLSTYRLALGVGLTDDTWEQIVIELDDKIATIEGRGFRITPMSPQVQLAQTVGLSGQLWVKDETGNVGGSHKARHLMGVMLYLRVLEAAQLPAHHGLRSRRLAIASCGNAALAAAVIARAADWPLDVFIPPEADESVVKRLNELGATINVCERGSNDPGDPCFLRFREAIGAGALPFGVQGTENGLAIEGGRTLAFEMAETLATEGQALDVLYVQVGGGALASSLAQGFAIAHRSGRIKQQPRLIAVQTAACAPLARAWQRVAEKPLELAAKNKSQCMWPWESVLPSAAGGILDDETYDWLEIVKAMLQSEGFPLVVSEEEVRLAHEMSRAKTDIQVSPTGSAGMAGLISDHLPRGNVGLVFSGCAR